MFSWKKILESLPGYKQLRKKYHADRFKRKSTLDVFQYIYKKSLWGNLETVSGGGSTVEYTRQLRIDLEKFIHDHNVHSILDIPCGDFNWMRKLKLNNIQYIGADIVPELVENNQKNFSNAGIEFIQMDMIRDALPKVDLIFCKDVFVHFSFKDIQEAIKNMSKTESMFIAITHFDLEKVNEDIITGEWRALDWHKPPFNFPEPLSKLTENARDKKYVNVWKVSDIRVLGINH